MTAPASLGPTFTARTPTDLVALVPVVLGFHPRDSVVLLTFGPPGRSFHARVDLPPDEAAQDEVVEVLVGAARTNAVARAAVLLYTGDPDLAESQGRRMLAGLLSLGVEVIEVLRVGDGEWFCVPDDGSPGTAYDLGTHAFTAQGVYAGRRVHRDRETLVATLAPAGDAARDEVAAAAEAFARELADGPLTLAEHARWLQRTVRWFLGDGPPGAEETARLLVLAAIIETRDVAWAEITREDAAQHVELWRHALRHAPEELVPAAASLLAFAAWQHGDGAMAWCALDRCVEVDADYSMARCLGDLLVGAVPPTAWRRIQEHELPVFGTSERAPRRSRPV